LDLVSEGVVSNDNVAMRELLNDYVKPLGQVVGNTKIAARSDDNILKCAIGLAVPVVGGLEGLRDKGHRSTGSVMGGWTGAAQSGCSLDISPGISAKDIGCLCFRLRSREERRCRGGSCNRGWCRQDNLLKGSIVVAP
jgi:hypothetical protein